MGKSEIHITIFSLIIFNVWLPESRLKTNEVVTDRVCDCDKLYERLDRGLYRKYLTNEKDFYTGKCTLKRDNKNVLTYMYYDGQLMEIIERYPNGVLCEEMYYDVTGRITKRIMYHRNGRKSYQQISGDHTYETFYKNGCIERKGGYGFTREDANNRFHNLYEKKLYDSIWKADGTFDSVYRYNKASITY